MSTVTFNEVTGEYETEARSDTNPHIVYRVSYDPGLDEFRCSCPAFTYRGRDYRHCKHIGRVGGAISDYIDSLYKWHQPLPDELNERLGADEDTDLYSVTLNGGADKRLDRSTVEWLFTALRSGDELLVQKL